MESMSGKKTAFIQGVRDISPILVGVSPFGLICGAVAVSVGMPHWGSIGLSLIIFAGASQLAAVQLMADHASMAVVILTGLVINARFLMYSASIGPHFRGVTPLRKGVLAYLLTDQAYAVSVARFGQRDAEPVDAMWYYLGSAVLMWTGFNLFTVLGAYLGAFIPPGWDLDFAIPLTFIAVVVPAIKDRPTAAAGAVAGLVALMADPLPYNLGLMVGAMAGIVTGYAAERRLARG